MTRHWHHETADASAAAINSMLQIYNRPYKGTLPDPVSERRAARSTVVVQHMVLRACVAIHSLQLLNIPRELAQLQSVCPSRINMLGRQLQTPDRKRLHAKCFGGTMRLVRTQ